MNRDIMKPGKLLQSQVAFFSFFFFGNVFKCQTPLECIWWFSLYLHPHVSNWIYMVSVFPASHRYISVLYM